MVSFQKIICILILGLSVLACSNVVSPNGESSGGNGDNYEEELFSYVISVFNNDQPINDVSIHLVDENNQLIKQLQTDENGQIEIPTIEGIHRLYAFKPGYRISILDTLFTKFEQFELKNPANLRIEFIEYSHQKVFTIRTKDKSTPVRGSTVEVLFDEYPIYQIHTDYYGRVEFDYEFDHERNKIRLVAPEVGINEIELNQISQNYNGLKFYNYLIEFSNLESRALIPLFSLSTKLPEQTTAINENGEQIPISNQNYIHFSIISGEKRHIRIEGPGVREHTYTFPENNPNVHVPIFLSSMNYEPLYEINQNTIWTFMGRKGNFISPVSYSSDFEMTWNFKSIEYSGNTRLYTITEVIDGEYKRDGSTTGTFEEVNTVKLHEDELGIWTYVEKSEFSPPLFQNTILPAEHLTLTMTDGTVQPIRYAPHSRILPVNTKELKYSYATSSPPDSYPNNYRGSYILSKTGFLKAQNGTFSRGNASSVSYDLISVEN